MVMDVVFVVIGLMENHPLSLEEIISSKLHKINIFWSYLLLLYFILIYSTLHSSPFPSTPPPPPYPIINIRGKSMINSKEVIKSLSMNVFFFFFFFLNLYVANWDFIQANRELKWVTNLQRAMIKAQKNSQFIFTI